MNIKFPKYYRDFSCSAEKCTDNCCIGWEIEIDSDTEAKYMALEGPLGQRLRENISPSADGEPARFITEENGRCPFLNGFGLCDIISDMGDDMLCDICKRHPRYYSYVDNIAEGGIALACSLAARVILCAKKRDFKTCRINVPYNVIGTVGMLPSKLLRYILKLRDSMCRAMLDESKSCSEALSILLSYSENLIKYIDLNDDPALPPKVSSKGKVSPNFSLCCADVCCVILNHLMGAELICPEFEAKITNGADAARKSATKFTEYLEGEFKPYLKRLLFYFIHRYMLSGAEDCTVGARLRMAVIYALAIGAICFGEGARTATDIAEEAKNFSKNIEYCEDNTNRLIDAIYSLDIFSYNKLTKMFINRSF